MVDAPTFSPCIVLGPIPFLSQLLSGSPQPPSFPGPLTHISVCLFPGHGWPWAPSDESQVDFYLDEFLLANHHRCLKTRWIFIGRAPRLQATGEWRGRGGRVSFRDGLRLVSTSRSVVFDWREAALKTSIIRRRGNSSADWPIRPEGGLLGGREPRRPRCCHGDGTTPSCCEAEGPGNPFSSISKPHRHSEL